MKSKALHLFPVILLFAIVAPMACMAQCNTSALSDDCGTTEGYTVMAEFPLNGEDGQVDSFTFDLKLKKDTNYALNICSEGAEEGRTDGIIVLLKDKKGRPVFTNNLNGKLYSQFIYPCKGAGNYTLEVRFEGSKNHCGMAVLSMK